MAGAGNSLGGALATTAFANQDGPDDGDDADTPEVDSKVTDTSSAGLNPSDPASVQEFSKKINDLLGRLNDSPEKTEKARTLAWAGGLNDPNGNGDLATGVVNAAKAESDFDYKDKALRAQYTPMIVQALTGQQQFAAQQKILNQPGGLPNLVGMPIDTAQRLNVALPGFKIMENWKLANPSRTVKGGSYNTTPGPNGGTIAKYYPNPKDNITMPGGPDGGAAPIDGAADINTANAGAHAFAQASGTMLGGLQEGMSTDGTPYKLPGHSMFAPGDNPFLSGVLAKHAGQNNPQAAMTGPLANPQVQPPAQTPAPPQGQPPAGGPPQAPAGPGAGPTPPSLQPQNVPPPMADAKGSFNTSNPRATIQAISQIPNPQDRANAFAAFMRQLKGNPNLAPPGNLPYSAQTTDAQSDAMAGHPQVPNGAVVAGPPGAAGAPVSAVPTAPASPGGMPAGAVATGLSAPAARVNANMTAYNKQFTDTTLPAVQLAGGQAADETIQAINTGQKALRELGDSGWGTDAKSKAAAIAAAMGMPGAEQYATGTQEFLKAIQQQNLQTLRGQKGAQSNDDSKNVAQANAALGSTKETNEYIFDVSRAIQERNQLKNKFYTNGVASVNVHNGGDLSVIDQKWQKDAPSILQMPSMQKYSAAYKKAGIPGY